jgi:uncharacterized protein YjbJ (UPF0337 family)/ElaB/YqjD/DUF883 family membrane-anchored ribosome-binding protein
MTQNTTYSGSSSGISSGSSSSDRRESGDSPSSNEIRADIDQTRSAVGEKIDKLQERLDPSKLKAQAQETVQEMINDTASSVTEYVRTHRDDMVTSLTDAARRNPLPTALVGLGVGWLILESISGGKHNQDDERYEYERRYFAPRRSSGRYEERYAGGMGRERGQWNRDEWNQNEWSRSEPLAGESFTDEYVNYTASDYPADLQSESSHGGGNGKRRGNPLAKAAGAVKETVSDVTGEIKDKVDEVKDRVGEMTGEMKERMGGAKEQMGDTMGNMRHQAQYMGERGQRSMNRAEAQMDQWQRRARYEGRQRGRQMMRNLEDNPLTYGALALAAGAALAILLPQTRTENRVFGEVRDEIMERGEEVFETAKNRAQQVATEMRPELEQTARKLVDDVKEAGKEVAQQAKEDLKPAMEKAMEKGKQEARNAAQEAGISTQGNKMALNKDSLRGQWNQVKGEIKSKWGQLTDDDLTRVEGDYEKLVGSLQTRYGYERARAEREVNDFFKSKA